VKSELPAIMSQRADLAWQPKVRIKPDLQIFALRVHDVLPAPSDMALVF
jgi:hypothetical protein